MKGPVSADDIRENLKEALAQLQVLKKEGRIVMAEDRQLLNIARTLGVPPSMLLAPMGNPNGALDLPNLSDDFKDMTPAQFDSWLSGTPTSYYQPRLADERVDIDILNSLRELGTLQRELDRLRVVLDVQTASADPDLTSSNAEVQDRIDRTEREVARLGNLLASAGLTAVGAELAR